MGDSAEIELPLIKDQFYLSESTIVGEKFGITDLTSTFNDKLQLYKQSLEPIS